jgi:hypothetical protein
MIENINFTHTFWERIKGYVSELRVDARWLLKNTTDNKPYGTLRICSHPDLPPGYLRSIFTFVVSKKQKNEYEIMKTIEDYCIDLMDMEVYSIDEEIITQTETLEAPIRDIEKIFGVKIFEG